MFVVTHRKIFFLLSAILIIGSVLAMLTFGFNVGIDFKGGSLLEIAYTDNVGNTPSLQTIESKIATAGLSGFSVRPSGEHGFIIRTPEISNQKKTEILAALSENGQIPKEERFNSIGPASGSELRNKAIVAVVVVIICIVLFITFAFRKVSKPVSSWKYGFTVIFGLVHDVIVSTGLFLLFIHLHGGETDLLFITAILAIAGYSVHDKIVVFDRVRENLRVNQESRIQEQFQQTVGKSIVQTIGRSINTSLTTVLVLVALYFLGGETTRDFAFVLLVGVIIGTYSSIFLASPLLVTLAGTKTSRKA